MKLKLFILGITLLSNYSFSQNLVINPSFEDTLSCSNWPGWPQMPCSNWFLATDGSSDYFNISYCGGTNIPTNSFGYQFPKTGSAYCGFSTYNDTGGTLQANSREYIEGMLINNLVQGHVYCVSFYVVNSNITKYVTNGIGVYFSADSVYMPDSSSVLSLNPQIANSNGIIYDTLNWVQISGSYTAIGGEKYLTIGNFLSDINTSVDTLLPSSPYIFSYLFIDDVSVVDCTVGIEEIKNQQLQFTVAPNPVKDKLVLQLQNTKGNNYKLEIFNAMGALLSEETLIKNSLIVDVDHFNLGVYFVKVSDANGKGAVKKFVKL